MFYPLLIFIMIEIEYLLNNPIYFLINNVKFLIFICKVVAL